MKRILLIILMIILSLGTVQAHASDISQNEKQILPVLIVNNSYSGTGPATSKYKSELSSILANQITKSLDAKYNVDLIDNTFNILDVASTEKNDILDMFKDTNYSIIILVEILPYHTEMYGSFGSIHMKILDIKNQKYLYNGKLWREKRSLDSILNAMTTELDTILKNVFKL
ncbi:hypothetical protein [Sporomusa aerivorans]|uniref:hypothetical protein n=1 Tax=Sporomusa aerivorans TaxID=204936 RepID=UPI00352BA7D5